LARFRRVVDEALTASMVFIVVLAALKPF